MKLLHSTMGKEYFKHHHPEDVDSIQRMEKSRMCIKNAARTHSFLTVHQLLPLCTLPPNQLLSS